MDLLEVYKAAQVFQLGRLKGRQDAQRWWDWCPERRRGPRPPNLAFGWDDETRESFWKTIAKVLGARGE
jgi:hypothetical protein